MFFYLYIYYLYYITSLYQILTCKSYTSQIELIDILIIKMRYVTIFITDIKEKRDVIIYIKFKFEFNTISKITLKQK